MTVLVVASTEAIKRTSVMRQIQEIIASKILMNQLIRMSLDVQDVNAANGAFEIIQDIVFPRLTIQAMNARHHHVI